MTLWNERMGRWILISLIFCQIACDHSISHSMHCLHYWIIIELFLEGSATKIDIPKYFAHVGIKCNLKAKYDKQNTSHRQFLTRTRATTNALLSWKSIAWYALVFKLIDFVQYSYYLPKIYQGVSEFTKLEICIW